MSRLLVAVLTLFLFSFTSHADNAPELSVVKQAVAKAMPNARVDTIVPAPLPGFYEVLAGTDVAYVSKDGKYMLNGDLFDLSTRQNLTEVRRSDGRKKIIEALDESSLIVFAPKQAKHTVTIFTDIDCGYCRKLHNEIKSYNERGIAIRYAAFPRSGKDTPSYFKAVGVWCADDRKAALTQAKQGGKVEEKKCAHPVDKHFNAGLAVGVSGTPTMVFADGSVLPGYVNATQLVQILEDDTRSALRGN